ncbi:MAG: ABC transporter substrate-binding protein [Desulfobacterales bacterium]|jgi:phospholipid transport system substrate-binding protein
MKTPRVLILLIFISNATAMADEPNPVQVLLKRKINAVISVLQSKKLDAQAKKKEVSEIVTPIFDFPLMAKLTLGKEHWPGLAEEKKKKFTDLFVRLLKDFYLDKINDYSDEKVVYQSPAQVGNKVHIPTELISKDTKISMLYKFYRAGDGWKIYDIEVEGVSLIVTYRSQFDQVLRKGTIDDLLIKLENREINNSTSISGSKQSI